MAYVSLYRKYRPQTFDDVVGQDHVTRTLRNAIDEDRLHHAYLFTGPRGTGKTSTARILAKAVNCVDGPTSSPCGTCEHCTAIADGTSVDVIELDMASHGGVDDARELRERAVFAPATARRKVYILDEVHMASPAAFNALLKVIEEPPAHVLFAMATTDPQKVLPTIMSRVQRLDLRRVAADTVAANVRALCEAEGYAIDDDAVEAIVRAGEGSLRDTQSILEQVLSFADGTVTRRHVDDVLGTTAADRLFRVVDLIAAADVGGLLATVQDLLGAGVDLRRFTFDLLAHLRDLLVLQAAPDRPDLVDATTEHRQRVGEQAHALPQVALLRAVRLLGEAIVEMRLSAPRLPLELALASLALPAAEDDLAALTDRVARLEAALSSGAAAAAAVAPGARTAAPGPAGSGPVADGDPSDPIPPPARASGQPAGVAEGAPEVPADADTSDAAAVVDAPGVGPDSPAGPPHGGAATGGPDPAPVPLPPTVTAGPDDLERVVERWDAVLDLVKDDSRRVHAVYAPATPSAIRNGILTLRYPRRYASFHAVNATKGEFAESLQRAVERACGLRVRVDTLVEGERRRPQPPVVGGSEPAVDEPPADEREAVREAESSDAEPVDPETARARAADLLRRELGAERVT